MTQTPPFCGYLVHPSWLHRFLLAPCVLGLIGTSIVATQLPLPRGAMRDANSSALYLIGTSVVAALLLIPLLLGAMCSTNTIIDAGLLHPSLLLHLGEPGLLICFTFCKLTCTRAAEVATPLSHCRHKSIGL